MRIRGLKCGPTRGSHLPILIKLVQITTGPILELGYGMYSTHFLHWACFATKRPLVTYEGNSGWFEYAKQFEREYHTVQHVPDWDALDLSGPWSIAFVDHEDDRRVLEARKVAHAEYVVLHDSDGATDRNRTHKFSSLRSEFKSFFQYSEARPHTVVFSNVHDLREFRIP